MVFYHFFVNKINTQFVLGVYFAWLGGWEISLASTSRLGSHENLRVFVGFPQQVKTTVFTLSHSIPTSPQTNKPKTRHKVGFLFYQLGGWESNPRPIGYTDLKFSQKCGLYHHPRLFPRFYPGKTCPIDRTLGCKALPIPK